MNESESAFRIQAEANGWHPTKRGWPDFFCETDEGDVIVVEVKRRGKHKLKREQMDRLRWFASLGVKAYRWSPDNGFQRIHPYETHSPWR